MVYNVTNRIKIVEVDEDTRLVRFGNISSAVTQTDFLLSTRTGLLFSDLIDDVEISTEFVYVASPERISILDSQTLNLVAFLSSPYQGTRFSSVAEGRAVLYIGANDGVYSVPKNSLQGDSTGFLNLKFNSDSIGGNSVGDLFWREVEGVDYLLVSHNQGLSIVVNDIDLTRKLVAPDSNPGKVYLSSRGKVYYQNGTSGFYFLDRISSDSAPVLVSSPSPDFIFSATSFPSIPSIDFKDLVISENTVGGTRNTVFFATASGISIVTESLLSLPLSNVENIAIDNVEGISITPGATKDSGSLFFTSNDPDNGGFFATYDLSLNQIINTISSSSSELIEDEDFTVIREF
jgi:hypothetical protein